MFTEHIQKIDGTKMKIMQMRITFDVPARYNGYAVGAVSYFRSAGVLHVEKRPSFSHKMGFGCIPLAFLQFSWYTGRVEHGFHTLQLQRTLPR